MNKYDEKMKALDVLKEAIDGVGAATKAIEDFVEKFVDDPEESVVDLFDLTDMVSKELRKKPGCVYDILETAFNLIKDKKLTLVIEEDEEDDK